MVLVVALSAARAHADTDAAAAPPDAGAVDAGSSSAAIPPPAAKTAHDAELEARRARVALLTRQRDAIRTLTGGSLPDALYTSDLFRVDLRDEPAVERRKRELEGAVASQRRALAGADAGAHDAGVTSAVSGLDDQIARLELEVDEARLSFLQKPLATRVAVLEAEAERRRLAEQQESAAAARQAAEGEVKAAEQARARALEEADSATSAHRRALATERARVEEARARLATFRRERAATRERRAVERQAAQRTTYAIVTSAREVAPSSPRADQTYDAVVGELVSARAEMRAALGDVRAPPLAPRVRVDEAALAGSGDGLDEARDVLRAEVKELAASADELDAAAQTQAWDALEAAAARVTELNNTRVALLDRLTASKRARVLGFGDEGIAQLGRELQQVDLQVRWWVAAAPRAFRTLGGDLDGPRAIAELAARSLGFFALFWALLFVRRRAVGWLDHLHSGLLRVVRRASIARRLQHVTAGVRAVHREALTVAFLLLLPSVAGERIAASSPFRLAMTVVLGYALYRLSLTSAHRFIGWLASSAAPLSPSVSARVLRSLRVFGRAALILAVFVVVCEAVLGRGYLYHLAIDVARLGSVAIAAWLVRLWRDDIAGAYIKARPVGSFASAVKKTRKRWYGSFVAVVALGYLASRGALRTVERFVLGFENSRRALAFLFRRRLERQAEAEPAKISATLPEEVRGPFTAQALTDEPYLIQRFPGLERFVELYEEWSRHEVAGTFLLVGRTGYGKTSWLNAAVAKVDNRAVVRLELDETVREVGQLEATLARAIGLSEETDRAGLVKALLEEPRVLVIDNLQNLVLRAPGAFDVWRCFLEVTRATADRVLWLCAIAHYPYEYLRWARRGGDNFREIVSLPPWSEEEIAEMLRRRTKETGYSPVYDDLLVDRVDGVDARAQVLSTERDYMRLIWDYSEGSPRVALDAWCASLVADPSRQLRVRLFRRAHSEELDELDELHRFVLACVVWHENVGARDCARTLRFSEHACADALRRLVERGVLTVEGGRFRVVTGWWPAVIRFVRRKHLIES